jgi:hypothetical protein
MIGWTGSHGETGSQGLMGPIGPGGDQGVTGLANYTQGPVFPEIHYLPHFHYLTSDDTWYTYESTAGAWIDISTGCKGITGPQGSGGIANFKIGELPELPSPEQPEFFYDQSDDTLYFWYTGAQAWVDIQTGCKGITGPSGVPTFLPEAAGYTGLPSGSMYYNASDSNRVYYKP